MSKPRFFDRPECRNCVFKGGSYCLTHETTWKLVEALDKQLFEAYIPMQRNRKHSFRMQFETLIDEYPSLTAKTLNTNNLEIAKANFPSFSSFNMN